MTQEERNKYFWDIGKKLDADMEKVNADFMKKFYGPEKGSHGVVDLAEKTYYPGKMPEQDFTPSLEGRILVLEKRITEQEAFMFKQASRLVIFEALAVIALAFALLSVLIS